jgi:ribonuclease-3 family protein
MENPLRLNPCPILELYFAPMGTASAEAGSGLTGDSNQLPKDGDLSYFLLKSLAPEQLQQVSPAALAYLGDAVFELYIRSIYLTPPKRIQTYHHQVVAQVRAESQAQHLRSLLPHLTPAELTILKRGRNAATGKPKRIDLETYQQATSLETLVGYLYLSDPQRLTHLFSLIENELNPSA